MSRWWSSARFWWRAAVASALLALAPLAIALLGLAADSAYLQTYHWLLFYSLPLGAPLAIIAVIVAAILTLRSRSRPNGPT